MASTLDFSTQVRLPILPPIAPSKNKNINTPPLPDGRGYPDISAQGLYFDYVWNGTFGIISGTSASTPLMSSILALVNDALISSGKPPLGFLNPWLYKTGYAGFTDIVNGFNAGCNTTGFSAVEGWDAVSGFGTPVFPKIVKLAGGKCD
jgi:tripeptidyl-peptidase-1